MIIPLQRSSLHAKILAHKINKLLAHELQQNQSSHITTNALCGRHTSRMQTKKHSNCVQVEKEGSFPARCGRHIHPSCEQSVLLGCLGKDRAQFKLVPPIPKVLSPEKEDPQADKAQQTSILVITAVVPKLSCTVWTIISVFGIRGDSGGTITILNTKRATLGVHIWWRFPKYAEVHVFLY